MSDFVFLYRGGERMPAPSPEQAQQQMQRWMGWLKELTEKGHIKDPGHPLERSGKLVKGRPKTVTDGPFAEAKEHVGGFCVVKAPSRDAALKWAQKLSQATTLPVEVRAFREEGRD